jgi:exodeoxyribonuclease-1
MLTDPALPTHYAMVRAIREKLIGWSPALFVGWNSWRFDEHFLRQALYQTLHVPYLTNTGRNARTDAMRLVQAASIWTPGALTIPVDECGTPVFKLERVAPANGFPHVDAHDAMADVEATMRLCRLVMERAPDTWSAFMRFSQKAAVLGYLGEETVFSLSDVYGRRAYSWLVTAIGPNKTISSEHYVFDLGNDPAELASLNEEDLRARLCQQPKPVRVLRCNAAPMLLPASDAPEIAESKLLGLEELERRAQVLRADEALCARLIATFEATRELREPSPHVEAQIYDRYINGVDEQRMAAFHEAPWEDRAAIIAQFEDERLAALGRRLIFLERPDVLEETARIETERALARRLAGRVENAPWLTLPQAIQDVDQLLAEGCDDRDRALLQSLRGHLDERLNAALALLV